MTNHFEVNFYRSVQSGHPILAIFSVRKIRQYPSKFGSGSMVESYVNPEVIERTLRFAEQIDFQGIGNIEYIYDNYSGVYYLVELNARLWQQNVQADHCGMNFPLIAYRDLLGEKQEPCLACKPGIKWMDVISDFQAFWEENRNGTLPFSSWLKSLKGTEVFATFAWDDWKPVLHEFEYGYKFIKFPLYVMRHWRNNDF
jgi:predicted ATP-grasp superfamily ATP-dependent carboligase